MSQLGVDYNFFDAYGIPLVAGRNFLSTDHKVKFEDINTVVLNLSAAKLLGIDTAANAIGREIVWGNNDKKYSIVGVVGDFHQESLKNPMEPMIFRPTYSTYAPASIKLKNSGRADLQKVVADVEIVFQRFFPNNAFDYSFLEEKYKSQYKDENRLGKVISVFTVLAIIISCLGLIGLSSYTAVQRTKEIGIRKVLGASLFSIVALLSSDFIKLVLIGTLLALPIAHIAMRYWLEGYAYKVIPDVWMYAIPVILMLLVASFTMSFQVLRSAMTNPSDTLKYE